MPDLKRRHLLFFWLTKHKSQVTFATVMTILVSSHEDTSTTVLARALASQTMDLTVLVNLQYKTRILVLTVQYSNISNARVSDYWAGAIQTY